MCDTIVITPEASKDGVMLFGKNSDREPNEAQYMFYTPAADHPTDSLVQCTYIEVPQVEHTHAILLSKPFWIWGAEMGVNEHGLAIGNEAVFTKIPYVKEDQLIGMDLLRLALERATSARAAVGVITDLLAEFGQGGNCGVMQKTYYHNSFLIADPEEAWILETADRHWAAKRIQGIYTISNCISIGNEWDLASPDLVSYAIERKWCKGPEDFDFSACYSDFLYTTFSDSRARCRRSSELLAQNKDNLTPQRLFTVLRDHSEPLSSYCPDQGLFGADLCMHAGFGPVRISQTAGSLVSHLSKDNPTHFFTGTSAPCTSIFKPVWMDTPLPDMGPSPTSTYDPDTLFWCHELLHRATLWDYTDRIQTYASERDELERALSKEALQNAHGPVDKRKALVAEAYARAEDSEARWLEKLSESPIKKRIRPLHAFAWRKFNRLANMPELP
jgi:secernin